MKVKRFCVVGIYDENAQRYATSGYGGTLDEAVADAIQECRDSNGGDDCGLRVLAVFRGKHPARDLTVSDSRKRPDPVRCRARQDHEFTVVREHSVEHVMSRNAVEAEDGFYGKVAGVFRGHLDDLSDDIDWDVVKQKLKRAA